MTSILLLIDTIYCNILRCNYLINGKLFLIFYFFIFFFFLHIPNVDFILNIFQKKDDPRSSCIFKFTDSEKRS